MKRLFILALLLSGCADTRQFLQSPQGSAILSTSEAIANIAVQAAATTYGGPAAGQLAGAGLDALATVLQGYINKPIPTAVVKAAPGIKPVANAVAPLVQSNAPVTQGDVNAVFKAASIAAKK